MQFCWIDTADYQQTRKKIHKIALHSIGFVVFLLPFCSIFSIFDSDSIKKLCSREIESRIINSSQFSHIHSLIHTHKKNIQKCISMGFYILLGALATPISKSVSHWKLLLALPLEKENTFDAFAFPFPVRCG